VTETVPELATSDPAWRTAGRTAWRHFLEDAARWIVPEEVGDPDSLTPKAIARLLHRHLPLRAMAWFRVSWWAKRTGIPGLPGIIQRRLLRIYGLELAPGADIGGGLYIAHPVGCTLMAERIGRNVTVIAAVTVGYRDVARWPRIDDGVYIGTGARVLGDIDIGAGAQIGANAVVIRDVPAGATAVGIPATTRQRP
jgi:serine O-acetyltransferase